MTFGTEAWQLIFMAFALTGAGVIRGYSGFGFSALVVAAASLTGHPLAWVAVVLVLESILSAQSWRGVAGDIDWQRIAWMLPGALIGLPLGIYGLMSLPLAAVQICISGFILLMCLGMAGGWRLALEQRGAVNILAGLASGFGNAPGMGGLPLAAFYSAQPMRAAVFRATLVAWFPILDGMALMIFGLYGIEWRATAWAVIFALPLVLLGNAFGAWLFSRRPPQEFRRVVLILLASLALMGGVKALSAAL